MNTCCCKFICNGCDYASTLRDVKEGKEQRCPYCRETSPYTDEECEQNYMKRVKANDPLAIFKMGLKLQEEGDIGGAIQYWTKAAALGGIEAHQNLSLMYIEGLGVAKDMKKAVYHMEEAAIGGHPIARFNLGNHEWERGRDERAMKHYIIAAKLGLDAALDQIKDGFKEGSVSKEDYEAALRGYQAAVDETKSQQRDAAEVHFKERRLSTN
jgi:TPR repeat protein